MVLMSKCYDCGRKIYRKDWVYCPTCGKLLKQSTKESWLTTMSDAAQLNRIEKMLKKLTTKTNVRKN